MKNVKTKTPKQKGIKAGIICFSVFMLPWLGFLLLALITDTTGFNAESITGTLAGIIVFTLVSFFFGFSIAKKSLLLIVLSSVCVLIIPVLWYFMPWLP
jgi:hypothetical protein